MGVPANRKDLRRTGARKENLFDSVSSWEEAKPKGGRVALSSGASSR